MSLMFARSRKGTLKIEIDTMELLKISIYGTGMWYKRFETKRFYSSMICSC